MLISAAVISTTPTFTLVPIYAIKTKPEQNKNKGLKDNIFELNTIALRLVVQLGPRSKKSHSLGLDQR